MASPAPIKKISLQSFVGFSNLPNQILHKSMKDGFQFTLMVVGESGLGKSTLINTLFNAPLYAPREYKVASPNGERSVAIQPLIANIEENNVKLNLTVIDTPGFGDYPNNEESWKPIVDAIDSRYDAYFDQENRLDRKRMTDTRVHACLYFIPATGHALRPLDIEFMKQVHKKVNLIPIISKADTLTDEEVAKFKKRINDDLAHHGIQVFKCPCDERDDLETIREATELQSRVPFAVVGSTTEVEVNGRKVRGRKYPWGIIEVENEDHNDFVKLRQLLIRSYMEDLRDHTNYVLYEDYRTNKLKSMGLNDLSEQNQLAKFEEERVAHEARMAKTEAEMKHVFNLKVQEKETNLRQREEEITARFREKMDLIEHQRKELEARKKQLQSGAPLSADKDKKDKKKKLF